MSILSSTQGTPERVWSIVGALAASGGMLNRAEAADLLNPGFTKDEQIVRDDGFNQTLGAATSLGVIDSDEKDSALLRLNPSCDAKDYLAFGDWVHDRLVSLDAGEKDAVLLQTYAWIAVETQRQNSIGWIHAWTNPEIADAADKALPPGTDDDGARRINTTKLPPWRRWLTFLGLLEPLPLSLQPHPIATGRVARELKRVDLEHGTEIAASKFLKILNLRVPYLDGGRIFLDTAERMDHGPTPNYLSPLLSATLRNLYDEKIIDLRIRGDASDVVELSTDPTHKIKSFQSVVVSRGAIA